MPTKRFDNVDPDKQKRILDAAREEFVRKGYEDASLNEIVAEADISKGSLYYYFEDKLDLFITVADTITRELIGVLGGIAGGDFGDDYWQSVTEYVQASMEYSFNHPDIMKLMRELVYLSRSPRAGEFVRSFYDNWKGMFADIVSTGQEMGAVRTDIPFDILVDVLYSLGEQMDYWIARNWEEKSKDELHEAALLFVDFMKRVAQPSPTEGGA